MLRALLCACISALTIALAASAADAQSAEQYGSYAGSGEAAIRATWPDHVEDAALSVAVCESGLDPAAYNPSSAAAGVWQFIPSTAYAMGLYNPYDPYEASQAAYKLYLTSGWIPWSCGWAAY